MISLHRGPCHFIFKKTVVNMRVFNGALAQLGARFAGSEEVTVQVSVSAPIGTVENKRIVASYGFIHTPVDLIRSS